MKKREKDSLEKRKRILSLAITSVMLFGTVAYFIADYLSSIKSYEGVRFYNSNGVWSAKTASFRITFYTSPEEFLSLNIPNESLKSITDQRRLYLSFNPNSSQQFLTALDAVSLDLTTFLMQRGITLQRGITSYDEKYSLPILNCSSTPMIVISESQKFEISGSADCLEFKAGSTQDILALRDLIEFRIAKLTEGAQK
ncbi:MAG: hypothetical protein QXJ50_01455 [Candidatus Woesearchaeota archaeon]